MFILLNLSQHPQNWLPLSRVSLLLGLTMFSWHTLTFYHCLPCVTSQASLICPSISPPLCPSLPLPQSHIYTAPFCLILQKSQSCVPSVHLSLSSHLIILASSSSSLQAITSSIYSSYLCLPTLSIHICSEHGKSGLLQSNL